MRLSPRGLPARGPSTKKGRRHVKPVKVARRIFDALERHYPDADTELDYRTPFELLDAAPADVEPLILSTGFFRQKSRSIIGMSGELVARFGGEVPADMTALVTLPGVGRKTANVVLGHALGVPGLPVDRHVLRVAGRLGLVTSDDPEKVEATLCGLLPPERWTKGSDLLILHGRRICRPKPLCPRCNARKECDFFRSGGVVVKSGERNRSKTAAAARTRARKAKR
jgi:endonuclease-3